MTTVKIGNDERPLSEADPHWIEREINGRRQDGLNVTVVVTVQGNDAELCLVAPARSSRGRPRCFTARETAVIDAWKQCGLNDGNFTAGNLIASTFLKQLSHLLG